ncbi:class II aldolase/adducin family protein [Nocardia jinanensis]|uniref:Class II aldolase/adducin family protein n=1 Tax=Nocardia jinanensis TaxID=382504 RepID=A0A917RAT6_9NOCA|nr:class II aldolase/adducin family protein [Nocardia jinanensis]GGK99012.1 class II aldolase/adducin family protein [Nocardia jinanensis]
MPRVATHETTYLTPPVFDSVGEEREDRKMRLVAALRVFARYGFNEGIAGHITVRDPEFPDTFWVNSFGTHFALICVEDLIRVDSTGEIVEGAGLVNSAAFVIHSAIHEARPDVIAAAHAHAVYGKTWSSYGELLQPLTLDACAFYEDHAICDQFNGNVVNPEDGKDVAAALGSTKAVIMQNHGNVTVGASVDEAAHWFIHMDNACHAQLLARSCRGEPRLVPAETARRTRNQVGNAQEGFTQFQPLLEWIKATDRPLYRTATEVTA